MDGWTDADVARALELLEIIAVGVGRTSGALLGIAIIRGMVSKYPFT